MKNYPRDELWINGKVTTKYIKNTNEIEEICDHYLDVFETGYVDSLQIHSAHEQGLSIEESVYAINELIDQGKVKHISI